MHKIILTAAAMAIVPQVAAAQALPAPVIAVVDSNKAANDCNACRTASASLQQQQQAAQQFQQTLTQPLQTEQQAIEAAAKALGNKEPDAALKQRATAFEQKYQNAQQQLRQRATTLERNRQYVLKQIGDKLQPAVATVQARRRANLVLDASAVLKFDATIDITNEVIAELNRTLPSIATTAPAQPATNPQGR
jgi:Skp family chaperone for outer membrane proteins